MKLEIVNDMHKKKITGEPLLLEMEWLLSLISPDLEYWSILLQIIPPYLELEYVVTKITTRLRIGVCCNKDYHQT